MKYWKNIPIYLTYGPHLFQLKKLRRLTSSPVLLLRRVTNNFFSKTIQGGSDNCYSANKAAEFQNSRRGCSLRVCSITVWSATLISFKKFYRTGVLQNISWWLRLNKVINKDYFSWCAKCRQSRNNTEIVSFYVFTQFNSLWTHIN